MGRSVMTLSGADAVAYSEFGPDEDSYREIWHDELKDGFVDPLDDFESWMFKRWGEDSEDDWDELVSDYRKRICELWPSFEPVEGEWVGDELRIIARNRHSIVTISEYSGIVALCLGPDYDRREFFADPSELAGISKHWRQQIAERFEREFSTLNKVGTMSNGSSVYTQTIPVPGKPSGVAK